MKKQCAWSSIELYDKYLDYGGQLVRKQLFTKLVTSFGNNVIVLNIEGCASSVGFRDYIISYHYSCVTQCGLHVLH